MVDDHLTRTRQAVERYGPTSLVVDDLQVEDLEAIAWSGSAAHIRSVASYLRRVGDGDVEYLAVRGVHGEPVAKGCIDYGEAPRVGTIGQLATRQDLQGLGLGSALIAAAEQHIRARGLTVARLAVEEDNRRARALYARLGYRPVGRRETSWEAAARDGSPIVHHAVVTDMEKALLT